MTSMGDAPLLSQSLSFSARVMLDPTSHLSRRGASLLPGIDKPVLDRYGSRSSIYPGLAFLSPDTIPRASFLIVRPEAKTISAPLLTVQEMVKRLRGNGLPIAAIAEIAKVERKTVYSWLDGADVREANSARVDTLFRLLNWGAGDYRSLHRVWNRKLHHGFSIKDLLCADPLSELAISGALSELSPAIERHSERENARRPPLGGFTNPVIDEMPIADIDL